MKPLDINVVQVLIKLDQKTIMIGGEVKCAMAIPLDQKHSDDLVAVFDIGEGRLFFACGNHVHLYRAVGIWKEVTEEFICREI